MKVKLPESSLFKRRNDIPVENLETIKCANCNYEFKGHFCPNCGQEVAEFNRPFGFVLYDFAGNFFAFDTRFFRTFRYLLFKPGFLAAEFFKGKRARYSPPFRAFVFLSFILFLLLQAWTERSLDRRMSVDVKNSKDDQVIHPDSLVKETAGMFAENTSFRVNFSDSIMKGIGEQMDTLQQEDDLDLDLSVFASGSMRENLNELGDQIQAQLDNTTDPVQRRKYNTYVTMCRNPEIVISNIMKYLSWMFFLFLPIFALVLKLFYIRRKQLYVKHLIFSIYLHSYLFFILILVSFLNLLSRDMLDHLIMPLLISLPIYFIVALRTFYEQHYGKVMLKFIGISFFYLIILTSGVIYIFVKSIDIV